MKKVILIPAYLLVVMWFNNVYSSSIIIPTKSKTYFEEFKNLKASEFVKLSVKNFSKISGEKMNFKERIGFSLVKIRMKKAIKKNQNLTVGEYLATSKKLGAGWIILISVAAILLLLILIYFISTGGTLM